MKVNILIADDELWIRKWLVKTIANIREDLEIVGAVDNGKDALDILRSAHVDILVTDIHMPLMTGLELAEAAGNVKVIMISGYDEFEYAKKAIQLRVMGYILKPIEKTELVDVLEKTIAKIHEESNNVLDIVTVNYAMNNLFATYFKNKTDDVIEKISEFARSLEIELMVVGEIQLDITENSQVNLKAFIEEEISNKHKGVYFYLISESTLRHKIILLVTHQNTELIFLMKQQLTDCIQRQFKRSRVLLSPIYSEIIFIKQGLKIVEEFKQTVKDTNVGNPTFNSESMYAIRSSMLLAIKSYDHATFVDFSNQLKYRLESKVYSSENFRMFIFGLVSDIIKNIEVTDGDDRNEYVSEGYEFCVKIQNYTNVLSMLEWTENYAGNVIKYLRNNYYSNVSDIVERVRKHLLTNYAEDISLSGICDQFGINRSYFSKLFKEESGMNFSDMLTNIRLDVASQLIVSTKKSLVDISLNVGFNDPKYFSRVFRKHYGMTPSQYREKY